MAPASAVRRGLHVGVVTAYPPSRARLTEYGRHLVHHLAHHEQVAEVVLLHDVTPWGAPAPSPGVTPVAAWRPEDLRTPWRIRRATREHRLDAVLFNVQLASFGDHGVPGTLGLLSPWLVRRAGVPVVVLLHDLADEIDERAADRGRPSLRARAARAVGRLRLRALLRADLLALTIPRHVDLVRDRFGADHVALAPHGSFELVPLPDLARPPGPRRVLAYGRWGAAVTADVLVDAYRELRRRGRDDVVLVVAGSDGPDEPGYLAELAARHADLPGLELTGFVADEDAPALFRSASVVAFPSAPGPGAPGVLHLAGEHGRAVVLPRGSELDDLVEDEGFAVERYDLGDAAGLADALERVLDDDELRTRLGRQNFTAAAGAALADVVHWHVLHLRRLAAEGGRS
ncbi:glycosyltransferase [Cellulomonas iranensis]|uniref:Glycosyltransferase involved in cell wall biosynthesis n=1 Tax=Cellulomonas iranensis TaxID=76862 RepID=A0ABU0GIL9_9CELL|nr:glycosyltransferase [Cellulomonas iranensis]MDQ0425221.1 glycosyltransferase involved in cell wall biosynthesis [Cellulomonas iranensis]